MYIPVSLMECQSWKKWSLQVKTGEIGANPANPNRMVNVSVIGQTQLSGRVVVLRTLCKNLPMKSIFLYGIRL
jgi:hypothetical protein